MTGIDAIPPLLYLVIIVAILSLVIELGFQLGKKLADERGLSKHPLEASVTTAILSLLAFMLGFSFATSASRYTKRRDLMLKDANVASTLHLRADFLPPEQVGPARELIREYLEIRRKPQEKITGGKLQEVLERSSEIQNELWKLAVEVRQNSTNTSLNLFILTLNDLIGTDAERRSAGLHYRLPPTLWLTLAFLGILSTTMLGVSSGLHGRRSRLATTALIIAFSTVFVLIIDIDRPVHALFKQGDEAREHALEAMQP